MPNDTESAANDGQLETWKEATRQGLLPRTAKKVWLINPSERLCPTCEALDGSTVELNEVFVDDTGKTMTTVFGDPLYGPHQHPMCMYTLTLEVK